MYITFIFCSYNLTFFMSTPLLFIFERNLKMLADIFLMLLTKTQELGTLHAKHSDPFFK